MLHRSVPEHWHQGGATHLCSDAGCRAAAAAVQGLERRVYTAGEAKLQLDPFLPVTPDAVSAACLLLHLLAILPAWQAWCGAGAPLPATTLQTGVARRRMCMPWRRFQAQKSSAFFVCFVAAGGAAARHHGGPARLVPGAGARQPRRAPGGGQGRRAVLGWVGGGAGPGCGRLAGWGDTGAAACRSVPSRVLTGEASQPPCLPPSAQGGRGRGARRWGWAWWMGWARCGPQCRRSLATRPASCCAGGRAACVWGAALLRCACKR